MIGAFIARFAIGRALSAFASKLPWQIWAALAVVLVLGGTAWYIDSRAYNRGFAEADEQWRVIVLEERKRQGEANEEATRLAQEEIARLSEAKGVRDATIRRLIGEAAQDVNADRIAIGVGSVRRINQEY